MVTIFLKILQQRRANPMQFQVPADAQNAVYDACVKSISNDYASALEDCKATQRCGRKFLDTLIKEKKEEYNVGDNISSGTICS